MNLQPIAHLGHEMQAEEQLTRIVPIVRNRRDPDENYRDWLLVTLADEDKTVTTSAYYSGLYCKTCDLYLESEWSWQ